MPALGLIVSTRLDPELANRFLEVCDRRDIARSDFLRDLVVKAIEADELEEGANEAERLAERRADR